MGTCKAPGFCHCNWCTEKRTKKALAAHRDAKRRAAYSIWLQQRPAWCRVSFPGNVGEFIYPDLARANNGRILARAMENLKAKGLVPTNQVGWAQMSRFLKLTPTNHKGNYSGMGEAYYRLVRAGKLPADPASKDKLFKLAGYPWK